MQFPAYEECLPIRQFISRVMEKKLWYACVMKNPRSIEYV
jgi:hypothetical protein